MMITEHLSAETFEAYLADWENEDSDRGRIVRMYRASLDEGASYYQVRRVALLLHYAEQAEGHAEQTDGLEYA
jgi:hypothetical protein